MIFAEITGGLANPFCGHTSDEFEAASGNCRKEGFFSAARRRETMINRKIGTREEWLATRLELL